MTMKNIINIISNGEGLTVEFKKDKRTTLENLFSMIDTAGIRLILKSNIHQKFAIIDKKITWYGSINLSDILKKASCDLKAAV